METASWFGEKPDILGGSNTMDRFGWCCHLFAKMNGVVYV